NKRTFRHCKEKNRNLNGHSGIVKERTGILRKLVFFDAMHYCNSGIRGACYILVTTNTNPVVFETSARSEPSRSRRDSRVCQGAESPDQSLGPVPAQERDIGTKGVDQSSPGEPES